MADIPCQDRRDIMRHSGLPDQAIVKPRAYAATLRIAPDRLEALRRGQPDQRGDRTHALQRCPGFLGGQLEGGVGAKAGERRIGLGIAVRGDGIAHAVAGRQQGERRAMMFVRLDEHRHHDIGVEQRITLQGRARGLRPVLRRPRPG